MIDFKIEYRNKQGIVDTEKMIDKIDIFLSKNKKDYKAYNLYGKQLVFKDYMNNLKNYNYDDILAISIYKDKIELGIYTEMLEKRHEMLKVFISKTKDKYMYEFIEEKFIKIWEQVELADITQTGGNNANNNTKSLIFNA